MVPKLKSTFKDLIDDWNDAHGQTIDELLIDEKQIPQFSQANRLVVLSPMDRSKGGDGSKPSILGSSNLPPLPKYPVKENLIPRRKPFVPKRKSLYTTVDSPGLLEIEGDVTPQQPSKPKNIISVLNQEDLKIYDRMNHCKVRTMQFENRFEFRNPFLAEPNELIFDSYEPYQKYEKSLIIRNIGSKSHRFSLTFNNYQNNNASIFSIRLSKTPTDNDGMVAPGLFSVYQVTFAPNSYADINSGDSLEYDFEVENSGGDARFMLMTQDELQSPFQLFENIGIDNHPRPVFVAYGPFNIYPSFFSLKTGESITLKILYKPDANGEDIPNKAKEIERIRIACDNCETLEFYVKVTIEIPRVTVLAIKDVETDLNIFEADHSDQNNREDVYLIDFQKVNIDVEKVFEVKIYNPTNLRIPFKWKSSKSFNIETEHTSKFDGDTTYDISPNFGNFSPQSIKLFSLKFTPRKEKFYEAFLQMKLFSTRKQLKFSHSEKRKSISRRKASITEGEAIFRFHARGSGIPFSASLGDYFVFLPIDFHVGQKLVRKLKFLNKSVSKISFQWDFSDIGSRKLSVTSERISGVVKSNSYTTLEFSFLGVSPGLATGNLICTTGHQKGPTLMLPVIGRVSLMPKCLSFDVDFIDFGMICLGEKKTLQIPLFNSSKVEMYWNASLYFLNSNEQCIIQIEPDQGTLESQETKIVKFTYIPLWYQKTVATLCIEGKPANANEYTLVTTIGIVGCSQTPYLLEPIANYVTSFVNVPFVWKPILQNDRDLPANFCFECIENEYYSVLVSPDSGVVGSRDVLELTVTVCIHKADSYNVIVNGIVENMVENDGLIQLQIKIDAVDSLFRIRVVDNEIALSNKLDIPIKLPLPQTLAYQRVDFGLECPIFVARKRTIRICNLSARRESFSIDIEKYKPTSVVDDFDLNFEPKLIKPDDKGGMKTNQMLSHNPRSKFGFSSKVGQAFIDNLYNFRAFLDSMKKILSDGRGAAFHITPSTGSIEPWGEVEITMKSYNNLVGLYNDRLICQLGSVIKYLPIKMGVIGIPIKFSGPHLKPYSKNGKDSSTKLKINSVNFGTKIINPELLNHHQAGNDKRGNSLTDIKSAKSHFKKIITVENHSPREVQLDWVIFMNHKSDVNLNFDFESDEAGIMNICKPQNNLLFHSDPIIQVSPSTMTIPAFKSANLECSFLNSKIGYFDAIALADIAYKEEDGSFRYAPRRNTIRGKIPSQEPINMANFGSDMGDSRFLNSLLKLNLQAKCIEPHLTLEEDENIKIKKYVYGSNEVLKKVTFLSNETDAVCYFTLDAFPRTGFEVIPSTSAVQKVVKGINMFELKPKKQLMITVCVSKDYDDLLEDIIPLTTTDSGQIESIIDVFSDFTNLESPDSIVEPIRTPTPLINTASPENANSQTEVNNSNYCSLLTTGGLYINYSNGMTQTVPILLEESFD
ncbi:Deleted in lung and esophageal cancer protein 1 [Globomyces sp. JEL0801]|nr:Deleted in lung and esophageal cancer protein 1 [Globomyces sp. JEL0801]